MQSLLSLLLPVSVIFSFYVLIGFVLYYIVVMRKFKKKRDEFMTIHETLKVGQNVVILSGIHGKIVRIYDDFCEVELNPNNVIKVSRYAISAIK